MSTESATKPAKNEEPIHCIPGQRICLSDDKVVSGQGTYEQMGYIYASLAGEIIIQEKDNTKIIEVKRTGHRMLVPVPGDIVTAKVLQVNQRYAKCAILCIGDHMLDRTYRAILRKEEVRATEKDRVEMYRSFRPSDIILARVLPQTELSSFQLTTAENELGVVIAVGAESGPDGPPMVPVSWTEMQCPNTLIKEPRKVAKVVPESAIKVETP